MRNLLNKEILLAASPLSFLFIAFAVMTFIPGYPILVGAFFMCFGIFQSFQACRENNDILYTVLLPVQKSDVVRAKYIFTCFIELVGFILSLIFTVIRMTVMSEAAPYVSNAMMNANPAYLAYILLVFTLFNCIFVRGFFRTGYKFSRPLITYLITAFILIGIAEALHHIPGLEILNATSMSGQGAAPVHWIMLAVSAVIYAALTFASYKSAVKMFDKVDL